MAASFPSFRCLYVFYTEKMVETYGWILREICAIVWGEMQRFGWCWLRRVFTRIESARQVRSASECVRRSHRQCLRRPTHSDAERTCRAVGPTQFTPPHTRHDKTVLSLSCRVCRCGLDDWCERVQTSDSLSATVLSWRESNSHRRSGGRERENFIRQRKYTVPVS